MTAKTTNRRTAMSGILASKAVERLLIVAAVVAVLVAFGAWYAMARPADAEDATASRSADSASTGAVQAPATATEEAPEAAAPSVPAEAPAAPEDTATPEAPAPESPAEAPAPTPETFLDDVTDSGLAPPVDDAQKLAMARDVCEEMGYGSTPEDMVRALTFAGATDAEAANFVQLAITNLCPEFAR